jgi:hypothetical protein
VVFAGQVPINVAFFAMPFLGYTKKYSKYYAFISPKNRKYLVVGHLLCSGVKPLATLATPP